MHAHVNTSSPPGCSVSVSPGELLGMALAVPYTVVQLCFHESACPLHTSVRYPGLPYFFSSGASAVQILGAHTAWCSQLVDRLFQARFETADQDVDTVC